MFNEAHKKGGNRVVEAEGTLSEPAPEKGFAGQSYKLQNME